MQEHQARFPLRRLLRTTEESDINMICNRCGGREFLDRVFTDNANFETSCLHCGNRTFIAKNSEKGQWLASLEASVAKAQNGLH